MIIFHELRSVFGQGVDYAASQCIIAVEVIFCTLGVQLFACLVTCVGVICRIEITVGGNAAHVVHRRSHRRFDACVDGCGVDSHSAPTADTQYADAFRVCIFACRQIVYGCTEVFGIDVGRSHVAGLPSALAGK